MLERLAPAAGSEVRCAEEPQIDFHEELQKKAGLIADGLSQAEAQKRLAQYGPNENCGKERQSVP